MREFLELVELAHANPKEFSSVPREECLDSTRRYVDEKRAQIREQHSQGASGTNVVRALSDLADEMVLGVYQFALVHVPKKSVIERRTALCAHGGYGRHPDC